MKKIGLLIILALISTGCSVRLTDFTAISTKNLNLPAKKGERVEAEDCAKLLFGLIPINGTFQPNLKQAIDNAIEKGNGDVLIDGVVYSNFIFIPLIYTQVCYSVKGTIGSTFEEKK